jgi:VanZ family protein
MKTYRVISFLAALVLFTLLFIGGENELTIRSRNLFWNLGHIPLFLILSYFMLTPPSPLATRSFNQQCLAVIGFTFLLGGFIEVAQLSVNRSMELADLARNGVGALLALVFFAPGRCSLSGFLRHGLQTVALILLIFASLPWAIALYDEQQAVKNWPVLASFEHTMELNRWSTTGDAHLSLDSTVAKDGMHSMKVEFGTSRYAGASLNYFPGDWSAQQQLAIHLYNPAKQPLTVTCRIQDKTHSLSIEQPHNDRFNQSYQLQPGWNQINITLQDLAKAPSDRLMDIRQIHRLVIFVSALTSPAILYIDNIYLAAPPTHNPGQS